MKVLYSWFITNFKIKNKPQNYYMKKIGFFEKKTKFGFKKTSKKKNQFIGTSQNGNKKEWYSNKIRNPSILQKNYLIKYYLKRVLSIYKIMNMVNKEFDTRTM